MTKSNTCLARTRAPLNALNTAVTIQPGLSDAVVCYIEGAIVGTVAFEGSFDSTNGVDGIWRAISASAANATNTYTQAATAAFTGAASQSTFYVLRTNGLPWVRMRVSAYTSGSAVGVLESRRGSF